jgi:hypothetical protein
MNHNHRPGPGPRPVPKKITVEELAVSPVNTTIVHGMSKLGQPEVAVMAQLSWGQMLMHAAVSGLAANKYVWRGMGDTHSEVAAEIATLAEQIVKAVLERQAQRYNESIDAAQGSQLVHPSESDSDALR